MSLEILKEIILIEFKTKDFSYENVSDQGFAEVYIVQINELKYVIRITKKPYSISNNYYVLEKINNLNLGPNPIKIDKINEFGFSIERFLDGEIIPNFDNKQLILILNKLVKLHSFKSFKCGYLNNLGNDWRIFFEEQVILRYVEDFQKMCPDFQKYIDYALNNIPSPKEFNLLHGNLNERNVLFTENEAFLFDFESAFYGEKEYDLGNLHFRMNFSNVELECN